MKSPGKTAGIAIRFKNIFYSFWQICPNPSIQNCGWLFTYPKYQHWQFWCHLS